MSQKMERDAPPVVAKPDVSSLAFSEIPHQSRLFTEYLDDPRSLKRFYPNAVAAIDGLKGYLPTVLEHYKTNRSQLCEALVAINRKIGANARTFENIERLREPKTVAVVTGQQAGLFTGPVYTIYKALSAIKAAERLTATGVRAVPVFWAATEDHDFEEVSSAAVWDRSATLTSVAYDRGEDFDSLPVGSIPISRGMASVIDRLFELLPVTEFSPELRESLQSAWSADSVFGDAFLRTISSILGHYGLILMDPMDARLKELAGSVYAHAIDNAGELTSAVISRGDELTESRFHTQVHVNDDYVPFFLIDEVGRRRTLRLDGEGKFRVRGERSIFSLDDLRQIAAAEPVRISPGVMLRPVVQDYLLPTICYFGGGAEVAYFAQNSEVYRILSRPVTPIVHRQSFTIIGASQKRFLDRYGLYLRDLFGGSEELRLRLAQISLASDLSELFSTSEKAFAAELERIDQALRSIDPTLSDALAKRRSKIMYHVAAMRKKALLAKTRKDETFDRRFESLFATLLPGGQLQERSVNVFAFLNKYGPGFIDRMYQSIDLSDNGHRIVYL